MSMQSTDPIADLLTRIRNAISVGKSEVTVPASRTKKAVVEQLVKSGFVKSVKIEKSMPRDNLVVTINGEAEAPRITYLERVSKPGRRVYAKADEIPRVLNGRGIVVVSTSHGVMTGSEARQKHLGGELICKVY